MFFMYYYYYQSHIYSLKKAGYEGITLSCSLFLSHLIKACEMSKESNPLQKKTFFFFLPILPTMNCTSNYWLVLFPTFLQIVGSVAKSSVLRF